MTALFALRAAAASGTDPGRTDAAYPGRWLFAAADGPDGELARSATTTRPVTPTGTLACSRRCSPGIWTTGQAAGLIGADGAAAACRARRTQRGRRRPTAQECTNFACRIRRCGGQPAALAAGPGQRVRVDPVPLCNLRQCGACPLPLIRPTEDPRPQISRATRSRDPPGITAALLAAGGARAIRRTMRPAPARLIRAQ